MPESVNPIIGIRFPNKECAELRFGGESVLIDGDPCGDHFFAVPESMTRVGADGEETPIVGAERDRLVALIEIWSREYGQPVLFCTDEARERAARAAAELCRGRVGRRGALRMLEGMLPDRPKGFIENLLDIAVEEDETAQSAVREIAERLFHGRTSRGGAKRALRRALPTISGYERGRLLRGKMLGLVFAALRSGEMSEDAAAGLWRRCMAEHARFGVPKEPPRPDADATAARDERVNETGKSRLE